MDHVFRRFLENSYEEAQKLEAESDILRLAPQPPFPPSFYLVEFQLSYLRRAPNGTVEPAPGPVTAVLHLPPDYLRSHDPHLFARVASVLTPDIIHPNISPYGTVCLGAQFAPGTPIQALLREFYEILAYENFTVNEANALNREACRLMRQHPELRRQLKPLPLVRRHRKLAVQVEAI